MAALEIENSHEYTNTLLGSSRTQDCSAETIRNSIEPVQDSLVRTSHKAETIRNSVDSVQGSVGRKKDKSRHSEMPIANLKLNGTECSVFLDSGSGLCLMSLHNLLNVVKFKGKINTEARGHIKGIGKDIVTSVGTVMLDIEFLGRNFQEEIVILPGESQFWPITAL